MGSIAHCELYYTTNSCHPSHSSTKQIRRAKCSTFSKSPPRLQQCTAHQTQQEHCVPRAVREAKSGLGQVAAAGNGEVQRGGGL